MLKLYVWERYKYSDNFLFGWIVVGIVNWIIIKNRINIMIVIKILLN